MKGQLYAKLIDLFMRSFHFEDLYKKMTVKLAKKCNGVK